MIILNIPGAVMVAIAALIAFGVRHAVPSFPPGNGPFMLILGPLCIALDLVYRWYRWKKYGGHWLHWFHPASGGNLILIPVWIFGVFWLVLGIVYIIQGHP